ncbi:serine hydrolase [Filimonas effusa]|uniref:Beta-lactamase class A catalytic domain-containing protein n=1 Tax=Filimonas effusa TaxID=2508721 RepID=A0A4Q1D197_9BACT|nr:serine hydrolase [Filimonas effusa]RXK81004.1 hypothetical protein ESB13_22900 [Filimonas effusa]
MRTALLSLFFLLFCSVVLRAQISSPSWLEKYIRVHASDSLLHLLNNPDSFRYQIIYTQINRDKHNRPVFTHYYFNVSDSVYFNPASMVKLPTALMALEKLNRLAIPGLNKFTPMLTDSAALGQHRYYADASAENGLPSVAQYIKKIFLVSDNDAYNRLNEFVGQQELNEGLWKKGYSGTRITRRFERLSPEQNRRSNPIRFVRGDTVAGAAVRGGGFMSGEDSVIYYQPAAYSSVHFDFGRKYLVGNAHYNSNDSLVHLPMDFTTHNVFTLRDMQRMLQAILFPASVPAGQRFLLSEDDYRFLYRYMSEYPSEARFPRYDTSEYFDSYTKFFFFKSHRQKIPDHIRVFNKTGWSYGFLTDAAYVVDFKNKVEFMLSGTIYVNRDGIINDDKYDYENLGYPFFEEIGKLIYNFELKRQRKKLPDLNRFRINYREAD